MQYLSTPKVRLELAEGFNWNLDLWTNCNVNLLHTRPELISATPLPIGTLLAEYRAYLIGEDGHFYDVFQLICADDTEAIEMAKKLVIDRDVELWQLDRKIGTFSLKQK